MSLLINGIDAYLSYGVSIRKGGLNALINFPSIKPVEVNDWHEEDGEEVDLSEIKLESKAIDIHFILDRMRGKLNDFLSMLSNEPYSTFSIAGRSYKLRMVDNPDLTLFNEFGLFSISFVDDFPISEDYVYSAPSSTISASNQNVYKIDGRSLSEYGVVVLKGYSEVRRLPSVKLNQRTDVLVINGLIYDEEGEVKYNAKDVQLECLMRANSTSEFWRNYDALLYDLTQPEERILFVDATGVEYPCYYKSCSTMEFFRDSGVWWRFNLTLRFTSFTIDGEEYLLASESGSIIITENGFAIDLNIN